jgi:hypothetical protein
MWEQVKTHVTEKNRTFRIADIEKLIHKEENFHRQIARASALKPNVASHRETVSEHSSSSNEDKDGTDRMLRYLYCVQNVRKTNMELDHLILFLC